MKTIMTAVETLLHHLDEQVGNLTASFAANSSIAESMELSKALSASGVLEAAREVIPGAHIEGRPPTTAEMLEILGRLRRRALAAKRENNAYMEQRWFDVHDGLAAMLRKHVPGFAAHDAQVRTVLGHKAAFKQGVSAHRNGALLETFAVLRNDEAREWFRRGAVAAFYDHVRRARRAGLSPRERVQMREIGAEPLLRKVFRSQERAKHAVDPRSRIGLIEAGQLIPLAMVSLLVDIEPDEVECEPEPEPVSDVVIGDPSEPTFKVKANGREITVSLSELLRGYSRQQDYTRKVQEVGIMRRELEDELQLQRILTDRLAQTVAAQKNSLELPTVSVAH